MNQFANHPTFYNKPVVLNPAQQENPEEVMKEFFDGFCLSEVRQTLWKMIHTSLSAENYFFREFHERDALLLFYEKLEQMLEAAFLLAEREEVGVCYGLST